MGSIFKTPKIEEPPPLPDYTEVAEEAKKKSQRYTGLGRAATILTSPLGVNDEMGKTLLGG